MDEGLAELLYRVVMLMGEAARRRSDPNQRLSHSQLRLLGTLEEIQPATQHQLAEALTLSDPAISRSLRPLEAQGYVTISVDPAHRRRRLVTLTPTGQDAFLVEGKPLEEELRTALLQAGFPYDRYLAETHRLAALLTPAQPRRAATARQPNGAPEPDRAGRREQGEVESRSPAARPGAAEPG
ncbi:MarR family transcriptional regulator [Streptomyces sp. NBC_01267]|uniref:MarR family winged helix-turn-helix transcriptional regulator n=1 Tax=unclassified Streptomyces TaxID=2593676 RepID=UPI002DDB9C8D|nr:MULTISPECIES: MarR family transcriptional regulator [unclassified Streptomyces]WSC19206.1 MarR family transcriptional regulator [Streptomyces sp. NBC_01766]